VVICKFDLQIAMSSLSITTNVVSSNHFLGEVNSIQYLVCQRHVAGPLGSTCVPWILDGIRVAVAHDISFLCCVLFFLRTVTCVPIVASASGLFIFDCPFCEFKSLPWRGELDTIFSMSATCSRSVN
jgi:hypothetical protein